MSNYKVYVYAICKNESAFCKRWTDSMREADGITVLDTGSTDGCDKILRQMGIAVYNKTIDPWRFDTARNESLSLVPNDADICVCTDLDEVFEKGWRKNVEKAWEKGADVLKYRYTWSFNPDGSEGYVFYANKIHSRHGFHWINPVHEVLQFEGKNPRYLTAEGVQLNHYPDPAKSRSQYLGLLESAVKENPNDDRNMHYLGREYMFKGMWKKSIETLKTHLSLKTAVWKDERAASMRYIGRCYLALGNRTDAHKYFACAVAEAPWHREVWLELAGFEAENKNWEAVIALCNRALQIEKRPEIYISESDSYGYLPYDLLSLAYYYTDKKDKAVDFCEKAIAAAPYIERLKNNLKIFTAQSVS